MLYGLTTFDVIRLLFDMVERDGICHPFSKESKMARRDLLHGTFSRHRSLCIRTPQGTNLARAVAFNKNKVQHFFHVYKCWRRTPSHLPECGIKPKPT